MPALSSFYRHRIADETLIFIAENVPVRDILYVWIKSVFFFGTFCCGGLDIKGSVWPDLAGLKEVSLESSGHSFNFNFS
jgi:hypothetical protein